jgi:hypothetical protein
MGQQMKTEDDFRLQAISCISTTPLTLSRPLCCATIIRTWPAALRLPDEVNRYSERPSSSSHRTNPYIPRPAKAFLPFACDRLSVLELAYLCPLSDRSARGVRLYLAFVYWPCIWQRRCKTASYRSPVGSDVFLSRKELSVNPFDVYLQRRRLLSALWSSVIGEQGMVTANRSVWWMLN